MRTVSMYRRVQTNAYENDYTKNALNHLVGLLSSVGRHQQSGGKSRLEEKF